MDADRYWQMRLRQLEEREGQLMEGLEEMGPEELRWTVRLLADALTEEAWQTLLAGYHERLPTDRMRAFLRRFIPECTQLAMLELHAKRGEDAEGLRGLTNTDLQNMSAMEKWQLIAADPQGLDPGRITRELARLALCFQLDLLHDAMLPRGVIEFPLYYRLQESLRHLAPAELARLTERAATCVPALDGLSTGEAAERLLGLRREIAQAAGIAEPLEEALGASMDCLPGELFPPASSDEVARDDLAEAYAHLKDLSPEDLRLTLQVLADRLTTREFQDLLGPHRSKYSTLSQMPAEPLRELVAGLTARLGNRGPCDFIQRYRTGKFLARPPINSEVWNLLPHTERLELLERDNAAMDVGQVARHLGKFLLTDQYRNLDDPAAQSNVVVSPLYQQVVQRLVRLGSQEGTPRLPSLNRTITELALGMEQAPRDTREERLEQIRRTIQRELEGPEAGGSVRPGGPHRS